MEEGEEGESSTLASARMRNDGGEECAEEEHQSGDDDEAVRHRRGYNPPQASLSEGTVWNPVGSKRNAPGTGINFRAQVIKAENALREEEEATTAGVKRKKSRQKTGGLFEIVMSLVGQRLCVELKNDDEISGIVSSSTTSMDIFLEDVREVRGVDGSSAQLSSMIIRGNTIRYVHLPPKIDVVKQLIAVEQVEQNSKRRSGMISVMSGREGREEGITKELHIN